MFCSPPYSTFSYISCCLHPVLSRKLCCYVPKSLPFYLGYVSSIFVLSINRLTNRTASFLLPVSGKGGLRDQKTNGKKPWSSFTVQEAVRSSGCPRGTEIHHMLAETCNARENWEILPVHSSVRMKRHKGGSCLRMNAEVVHILQQVFTNTPTKPQVRIIM